MDLTGLLTINGLDAYSTYNAFLAELNEADHSNMDELRRVSKSKSYSPVSFREENGEKLPAVLNAKLEPADRSLQFCLFGATETELNSKYTSFMTAITSGWLTMIVKDLRTYKLYYQEQSSITWYDHFAPDDPFVCVVKIKFREPEPTI